METKISNAWLPSYGILVVENKTLRLVASKDLILYYKSFVDKEFKIFSHLPAHGAHVSILLPKIHNKWPEETIERLLTEFKEPIKFEYNPDIQTGGYTKGFLNFIIDVRSDILNYLTEELDIEQNFHMVVGNTKNGVKPYIWMK